MAVTAEQLQAINDWFAGDRETYSIRFLAKEFVHLRSLGCDWPAGSVQDYKAAIGAMVERGELVLVGDSQVTRVGAKGIAQPKAVRPAKEKQDAQLTLF